MTTKVTEDVLQNLLTRNINLNGRRIVNAGNARDLQDYITKFDLRNPKILTLKTPNGILLITFTDTTIIAALDISVPDEIYSSEWNTSLEVPTKNAIYDKIETLITYGAWVPALDFGGGVTGITYSNQFGTYEKRVTSNGTWVSVQGNILLTSKGSSVGNASLGGLPFAAVNSSGQFVCGSIVANLLNLITGQIQISIAPNTAIITLSQLGTGTAAALTDANVNNNSSLIVSATYKVN